MTYTKEELEKILDEQFINNPKAFEPGRRNDDTVDCMIIAHCCGIDPVGVVAACEQQNAWSDEKHKAVMEHVQRVQPYLEGWGTFGTMEAMVYTINY